MHPLIIRDRGEQKFTEYDFKSREEKLRLPGVSDQQIIDRAMRFRKNRKALVHEKTHFSDGEITWAQEEVANAHEPLVAPHEKLSLKRG